MKKCKMRERSKSPEDIFRKKLYNDTKLIIHHIIRHRHLELSRLHFFFWFVHYPQSFRISIHSVISVFFSPIENPIP